MTLVSLEEEWTSLFRDLRTKNYPHIRPGELAAPFLSIPYAGYEPDGQDTMMLVGKATFNKNTSSMKDVEDSYTIDRIKERTRRALDGVGEPGEYSAFTSFMLFLSNAAAREFKKEAPRFRNLIWTNLAKIGQIGQNPSGALLRVQDQLAVDTLVAEIETYRPKLVIFATGYYCYGRINRVIEKLTALSPDINFASTGEWHYCKDRHPPAILWTGHPQGKPDAWWSNKAETVLNLLRRMDR